MQIARAPSAHHGVDTLMYVGDDAADATESTADRAATIFKKAAVGTIGYYAAAQGFKKNAGIVDQLVGIGGLYLMMRTMFD